MGRLKIKKKGAVVPFRQTMAYRMLLLTLSILFFIYTLYEMVVSLAANNTLAFIMSAVVGVAAAFAVFYNLDHISQGNGSDKSAMTGLTCEAWMTANPKRSTHVPYWPSSFRGWSESKPERAKETKTAQTSPIHEGGGHKGSS